VRLFPDRFELVLDAEGLTISPGEAWDLEEALVLTGPDREALLAPLAGRIARHHPRLPWAGVPTGWCSWYWYGPGVSEADITANLRAIAATGAGLRYVQVDDGYQPHMGDWLETGPRFPGGMRDLCARIKDAGFEPAVWVAPFIAERGSRLAREHPDWLVQEGATGTPLLSSDVSFGGWRNGPWYALDGTHPGALAYLESVFATMRREWDCHYFKLDALYWGALHGGSRHDRGATRVEAYRRGMAAVRAGAGPDSFLLGCNAPMWASLGAVHGMRVSNDVARAWDRLVEVAREAFARSWQHGRLWVNDPDCLILINRPSGSPPRPSLPGSPAGSPPTRPPLTGDELRFHASAILASGGMVLAGDDTTALAEEDWRTLGRLVPPLGVAARFAGNPDGAGDVLEGVIDLPGRRLVCRFNPSDAPVSTALPRLPWPGRVADFWSGGPVGTSVTLPRHGARVLECTPRPAG
jgi:alpha-galactosidase